MHTCTAQWLAEFREGPHALPLGCGVQPRHGAVGEVALSPPVASYPLRAATTDTCSCTPPPSRTAGLSPSEPCRSRHLTGRARGMGRNTQGAAREATQDSKDQLMGDFGYTASNVTCLIPRAKTEAAVWLSYRRASWATASWAARTASAEECAARTEASSDCSDSSALQQRPDAEGRLQPGVGAC